MTEFLDLTPEEKEALLKRRREMIRKLQELNEELSKQRGKSND